MCQHIDRKYLHRLGEEMFGVRERQRFWIKNIGVPEAFHRTKVAAEEPCEMVGIPSEDPDVQE